MSDFAVRFRELRQRKGLSSSELARPRYSVSFVSQIERGLRRPSVDALRYFARKLGVSSSFLETGIPDDLFTRLRYDVEEAERKITQDRPGDAVKRLRTVIQQTDDVTRGASAPPGFFGLESLRGAALTVLGDALARTMRFREAIEAYEDARAGDLPQSDRVRAVVGLARAFRSLGDLGYAAGIVEEFLRVHTEPPLDAASLADLQSVLVSIYFERGDITAAERAAERALAAASESTSPLARAEAWWASSRVLAERGQWDEALDMAKRARMIMEGLTSRRDQASLHIAYAFLCLEAEPPRIEETEAHLDLAESILDQIGATIELAFVHTERALLACLRGRYEDAVAYAKRTIAIEGAQEIEKARALFLQGRALAKLGRSKAARATLHKAAAIFQEQDTKRQLASCWRELGRMDEDEGNDRAAVESYRSALDALEPLSLRP